MISLKEKEVKQIIALLNNLHQKQSSDKLSDFIKHLESDFEEQRMMTRGETDKLVEWAVKKV